MAAASHHPGRLSATRDADRVYNEYGALIAEVDLGWRDLKIAVQYEGDHHRTPQQFAKDIRSRARWPRPAGSSSA